MSIGEALAAGRQQAGLTVAEVSQRTRIRETIVRGIERDDFSGCGGDFYARGHIRAIAKAAGVDPEPLVREYDASQEPEDDAPQAGGAPEAAPFRPATSRRAAEPGWPSAPLRLAERRRPNWTIALVVVLAVLAGLVIYHFVASDGSSGTAAAGRAHAAGHRHPGKHPAATSTASASASPSPSDVVISLTAGAGACWVNLTTSSGTTIYQGILAAGASMSWTERQVVSLQLGNPGVITLAVNGKTHPSLGSDPVTLSLGPDGQDSPGPG